MTQQTQSRSRSIARKPQLGLMASMMALSLGLCAYAARAEDNPTLTAIGISTFGDLHYAADFAHLDYVNPDAPKGGEISEWAPGTFDSMNPYSVKGVAGALSSMSYESMLVGTADEIGASYCLLCSTIEYPQDRSWVIFNLRPEAKFSDGTPLTAEDVQFSFELFRTKGLSDFRAVFNEQVEGAEILDPHRIKFSFKPGVPTRDLPADVGGLPVFSKAQYQAQKLDL